MKLGKRKFLQKGKYKNLEIQKRAKRMWEIKHTHKRKVEKGRKSIKNWEKEKTKCT